MLMALKSFTNRIRAWRDGFRRAIAVALLDRTPRVSGEFEEAILFVRWDAKLGDTVVLSWVWRAIKRHRPDLKLWIVTGSGFYDLFESTYGFDKVVVSPRRPSLSSIFKIARQLKRPRYVVHLSEALKARDLAFLRLIEPAHVVGLDDALKCIDIKIGAQTEGCHFSQKLVPLLQKLSVASDDRRYWLPDSPVFKSEVMSYWKKGVVIGFCPYGASRHRSFSTKKIVMTIQAILVTAVKLGLDMSVFLIVTADKEEGLIELLENHHLSSHVFLRPTQSLLTLFEQVRACSGIVSVDTSIVHVATGLGKPQLAIYKSPDKLPLNRSSNYASWHPNSRHSITFVADSGLGARIDDFDDDRFKASINELLAKIAAYDPDAARLTATT
jgi:ADP-heptose:LPS heptosyltransferase